MKKGTTNFRRGVQAPTGRRVPGRPREFNEGKALDRALRVFWERGYEGASLTDLTKAMGVTRPSLYSAFGNKEALFRRVLDRYGATVASFTADALAEPTARAVVARMFRENAEMLGSGENPRGCLMVQGALACGVESRAIQRELCVRRAAGEAALRQRLERAKLQGDLRSESDAAELAAYVMAVLHGMAVQAVGGASKEKLHGIAARAMQAWVG